LRTKASKLGANDLVGIEALDVDVRDPRLARGPDFR